MQEERKDLRFFGRRKSRPLKPRQQRLMESLLPAIRLDAERHAGELQRPTGLFDFEPSRLVLEIGFGGGEHLVHRAHGQASCRHR